MHRLGVMVAAVIFSFAPSWAAPNVIEGRYRPSTLLTSQEMETWTLLLSIFFRRVNVRADHGELIVDGPSPEVGEALEFIRASEDPRPMAHIDGATWLPYATGSYWRPIGHYLASGQKVRLCSLGVPAQNWPYRIVETTDHEGAFHFLAAPGTYRLKAGAETIDVEIMQGSWKTRDILLSGPVAPAPKSLLHDWWIPITAKEAASQALSSPELHRVGLPSSPGIVPVVPDASETIDAVPYDVYGRLKNRSSHDLVRADFHLHLRGPGWEHDLPLTWTGSLPPGNTEDLRLSVDLNWHFERPESAELRLESLHYR